MMPSAYVDGERELYGKPKRQQLDIWMHAVSRALSCGSPQRSCGGCGAHCRLPRGLMRLFKGGPHVCAQSVACLPQSEQWHVVGIRTHGRLWLFSFIPLSDTGSHLRPTKGKLSQSKLRPVGAGPSWTQLDPADPMALNLSGRLSPFVAFWLPSWQFIENPAPRRRLLTSLFLLLI